MTNQEKLKLFDEYFTGDELLYEDGTEKDLKQTLLMSGQNNEDTIIKSVKLISEYLNFVLYSIVEWRNKFTGEYSQNLSGDSNDVDRDDWLIDDFMGDIITPETDVTKINIKYPEWIIAQTLSDKNEQEIFCDLLRGECNSKEF